MHRSSVVLIALVGCRSDGAIAPVATTTGATTTSLDGSSGPIAPPADLPLPAPTTDGSTGASAADVAPDAPPPWDPPPPARRCEAGRGSTLLDEALDHAGLQPGGFLLTEPDFESSSQYQAGVLGGDFAFAWLWALRADGVRVGCFEGETAGGFDHALDAAHPIASAIRVAAARIDRPVDDAPPVVATDWTTAIDGLCATLGGCDAPQGELPPTLAEALAPVVVALHEGVAARLAMDGEPGGDPSFWHEHGGNPILIAGGPAPATGDADVRAYMLGHGARTQLYRAAAQIAFAIEDVDWSAFAGRVGVEYTLVTPAGRIELRDASVHHYAEDTPEVLLRIDTGGADVYEDEVAANRSAANPVSVAIDLGGADSYGYATVATPYDRPELLPADIDGRAGTDGFNGNYSRSKRFRQGAARNGIAMLFDLGDDDDVYRSLRGSQGYAHHGVGVLFDAGGDDDFAAEANAQGAAIMGIGLLVDGDGNDRHRSFTQSQGFGFAAGIGALVDGDGDDGYDCDVGDPALGGLPLYYSPQLPETGNTSMCQGAGYGARSDGNVLASLAGGLGVLRDRHGTDAYDASVFAQGTGYWEGVGLLADGDGDDRYDARWYVQGGAAHYAVGVLADGSGDDRYGTLVQPINVTLGSGHDFSLGALVDGAGHDEYRSAGLALGSSNCNALGLFVDGDGDDLYTLGSDLAAGLGNISPECIPARPDAASMGLMLDGGGTDVYVPPGAAVPEFIAPTDGGTWGYARASLPSEHGGGRDGQGPTGVRVESVVLP